MIDLHQFNETLQIIDAFHNKIIGGHQNMDISGNTILDQQFSETMSLISESSDDNLHPEIQEDLGNAATPFSIKHKIKKDVIYRTKSFTSQGNYAHRAKKNKNLKLTQNSMLRFSAFNRSKDWSATEVALFYEGLRTYGTDMEMIRNKSTLLPHKTKKELYEF